MSAGILLKLRAANGLHKNNALIWMMYKNICMKSNKKFNRANEC